MNMHSEADRLLQDWCGKQLGRAVQLHPIPGDAGFRRYFRLQNAPGRMAVSMSPQRERIMEFLAVRRLLQAAGVRVPALHAADTVQGFLLLEDLGEHLFLDMLDAEHAEDLYCRAVDLLLCIQNAPRRHGNYCLPAYDRGASDAELILFVSWFVEALLGVSLSTAEQGLLKKIFRQLAEALVEGHFVPVHRDYHSRNLLVLEDGSLAVIDFQDAAWGSDVYDLASLLKDCYIHWPRERLEAWVDYYRSRAQGHGLTIYDTPENFLRRLDWVGLQRHLKVLGVFARLSLRDNKNMYLQYLPRVLFYVRECCTAYAEFADFGNWYEECLAPPLSVQPWMREEVRCEQ